MKRFVVLLVAYLPWALPLYLVRFRIGPLPTTLLEIFLGVLFVTFTIVHGWKGWREGWKDVGAWRWPVLAWFVASLAAVFWAPDPVAGFGLWRAYVLEPALVFTVLATVKDGATIKRLQMNLCYVVIFLAAWVIIQFATGWGIPHPWNVAIAAGRRATGPFPYPNALALFVVPIGAWAGAHWVTRWFETPSNSPLVRGRGAFPLLTKEGIGEVLWGATWIAALVAVLLAKSDGGLIALLAAAFVTLVVTKKTRIATLVATACLVVVVAAVPVLRSPVLRQLTFQEWSGQVRLFQWRETWQMLQDHPILGAGFGGYPTVFAPYHKATAIEIFQYPHNILFNFWSETGILGVLAFGWVLGMWIWYAKKTPLYLPFVRGERAAPLIAIIVHGLVDVPYFKNDLAIVFWLLVWLVTIAPDSQKEKTP